MASRRYWDSGVFIAWLAREDGRIEHIRSILKEAEAGRIEIWTSAFTLTEILWPKGRPETRDQLRANREMVRQFLRQSFFKLVEVDRKLAEIAQEVVWEEGVRPKDAIHLASAIRWKLMIFETFDGDLIRLDGKLGDPPIQIAEPFFQLPPEKQQPDLFRAEPQNGT